jgi:DNA polymerase III delta prime subunit
MDSTPWVEKYRPSHFDEIVLDPINKLILTNIIKSTHFPNLLFYGPPGTGKTTTIMNLVNEYQMATMKQLNGGFMIHLNASDERGIDIIRNQINMFVTTRSLFGSGIKFVILDEVDHMTKNAQTALRYILNSYNYSKHQVRFCLICNYISRIDEALQTEFVRLRFNQLPIPDICKFMQNINLKENLNLSYETIESIQVQFNSDVRSMVNYMQTNQDCGDEKIKMATKTDWDELTNKLKTCKTSDNVNDICVWFMNKSHKSNLDIKHLMKLYMNHIVRNVPELVTPTLLDKVEHIMHSNECKMDHIIHYFVLKISKCFQAN